MKIEKLSESSLKITLNRSESDYFPDDWDKRTAEEFLAAVSDEIQAQTGADLRREKLYVEIFSRPGNCVFFVSFPGLCKRRCRIACSFTDFESLRNFCCKIDNKCRSCTENSSLFYSSCSLRLVLEIPYAYCRFAETSAKNGSVCRCDPITDAVTSEHYRCCLSENAVKTIIGLS